MPNPNADEHYPTVDVSFMHELIESSNKIVGVVTVGSSTAYIMAGARQIGKRMFSLRETEDGTIDYMYATGLAIRLGCIGGLLDWLEVHRNWKDGAYIQV